MIIFAQKLPNFVENNNFMNMNIENVFAHKSLDLILSIVWLFILPSISVAKDSDLYLYEPSESLDIDSMKNILLTSDLECTNDWSDSIYVYEKENIIVRVSYYPKSRQIYGYLCSWVYNTSLEDEFSIQDEIPLQDSYNMSKLYFKNVFWSLCKKYGKPTSVMINKDQKIEDIVDKAQLDTLDFINLLSKKCFVRYCWENVDKRIRLGYDNTVSISITYDYLNFNVLSLRNRDIATSERSKILSEAILWTLGILTLLFIVIKIHRYNRKNKEKEEKQLVELMKQIAKEEEERESQAKREIQERETRLKQTELTHNSFVNNLIVKYGTPDKAIRLNPQKENDIFEILVFSKPKHVSVGEKVFSFSDILDCTINDNVKETETIQTYRGESYATTKTNTGNMIGRSIVGGVLLGEAGAIIGGSTANKQTIVQHGTDTSVHNKEVEHNYTIAITVKDLSNPVIYLNVGNNTVLKDEIVSLMKVIISMR